MPETDLTDDQLTRWLDSLLASIPSHLRQRKLYVAFSGGLDSTVLLAGLARLQQAGHLGESGELVALHVHHGLQVQADAWVEHAHQVCQALAVVLRVLHVHVDTGQGGGLEAAARTARYAALADVVTQSNVLLTAHHLDDQAETLLLQMMRGAGVRGMASMPALQPFAGGWHLRPLLTLRRDSLHTIALKLGLTWVDDPSNADVRHARNLLRHRVLPALTEYWPHAAQTLARCAQRMATTEGLLHDLARIDLAEARGDDSFCLALKPLRRLSQARLQNAVRAWLLELGMDAPPEARLQELGRVLSARADALPVLAWSGGALRRWRDALYALPHEVEAEMPAPMPRMLWAMEQPLNLPALGLRLLVQHKQGRGLSWVALARGGVMVCVRHEDSLPVGASRSNLSKRLQELTIPPWQRARLPLFYLGDKLLQIADLWRNPAYMAKANEEGISIHIQNVRPTTETM
jgi:tRNA(Ile)-lysidine synthase